jgi:hypothetical protein
LRGPHSGGSGPLFFPSLSFTTSIVAGWFPSRCERPPEPDSADDSDHRKNHHKEIGAPTVIRIGCTSRQYDKTAAKA